MNFAALKTIRVLFYLSSFNHEHAPECPCIVSYPEVEETSFEQAGIR